MSDIGSGGSAANELTNFDESATTTGRAPSQQRRQGAGGGADMLNAMLQKTGGFERLAKNKEDFKEKAKNITARAEVSRQMTREWHKGDVYTPRDLGWFEAKMWKQPKKPTKDIIDVLGINPLDHYKVRHIFLVVQSLERLKAVLTGSRLCGRPGWVGGWGLLSIVPYGRRENRRC